MGRGIKGRSRLIGDLLPDEKGETWLSLFFSLEKEGTRQEQFASLLNAQLLKLNIKIPMELTLYNLWSFLIVEVGPVKIGDWRERNE